MASIRVLRERREGDRSAVALTVVDGSGQRYRVIRELVREDEHWRVGGGFEGIDRVVFFFGLRESPDPATAEFLDRDGRLIATHVTLIDEQDPPAARRSHGGGGPIEVVWRELTQLTHVAVVDETVAGVLYAERASDGGHDRWNLCWLSSERPDETYVLFGASELRADAWATRWDRAHLMVDRFLRRAPPDPS